MLTSNKQGLITGLIIAGFAVVMADYRRSWGYNLGREPFTTGSSVWVETA